MSGLAASLFRPGRNERIEEFTNAVADGVMYPADIAGISTTAPASQGVTVGEFEGKTLNTLYDYIECELASTANGGDFPLGVIRGKGLTEVADWADVSGHAIADGDVVIIQRRGIVPAARTDGAASLGDYAINGDTGEITSAATAATNAFGVCLTTDGDYQRISAADQQSCVAYISC